MFYKCNGRAGLKIPRIWGWCWLPNVITSRAESTGHGLPRGRSTSWGWKETCLLGVVASMTVPQYQRGPVCRRAGCENTFQHEGSKAGGHPGGGATQRPHTQHTSKLLGLMRAVVYIVQEVTAWALLKPTYIS